MNKFITYGLLIAVLGFAYYYIMQSPSTSAPSSAHSSTPSSLKQTEQQAPKPQTTSLASPQINNNNTAQIAEPDCEATAQIQLDAIQTKNTQKYALLSIREQDKPLTKNEYQENQAICKGILLKQIKATEIIVEIQGELKTIPFSKKPAEKKQIVKQKPAPAPEPAKNKDTNSQENPYLPERDGPWDVISTPPPPFVAPPKIPEAPNKRKLSPAQSPEYIPPPPDTPAPF